MRCIARNSQSDLCQSLSWPPDYDPPPQQLRKECFSQESDSQVRFNNSCWPGSTSSEMVSRERTFHCWMFIAVTSERCAGVISAHSVRSSLTEFLNCGFGKLIGASLALCASSSASVSDFTPGRKDITEHVSTFSSSSVSNHNSLVSQKL